MFGTFASAAVRRSHACGPFDLGQDWKQADTNEIYRIVRQGTGEQCWELQYLDTGEGAAVTNTDELHVHLSDAGNDESGTGSEAEPFLTWDRVVEEVNAYTHIGLLRITLQDDYTLAPTTPINAGTCDALVIDGADKETLATVTIASGAGGQILADANMTPTPEAAGFRDCFAEALTGNNAGALRMLQGYKPLPNVACATTANITLSGEQTIDGVLTSASLVLVKNQSTASQNGVYRSGAGAWTRAVFADTYKSLIAAQVTVAGGSTNNGQTFRQSAPLTSLASSQTWSTNDLRLIPVAPFNAAFATGNTVRVFTPSATLDVSGITGSRFSIVGRTHVTLINVNVHGFFWCEGTLTTAAVRADDELWGEGADHGVVFNNEDRVTPILGSDWYGCGVVLDNLTVDWSRMVAGYVNARNGLSEALSVERCVLYGGRIGASLGLSVTAGGLVRVEGSTTTPFLIAGATTVSAGGVLDATHALVHSADLTTAIRVHTGGIATLADVRGGALSYGVDARGGGRVSVTSAINCRGETADARVNAQTQPWSFFAADGDTINDTDGSVISRGTEGDNTGGAVVDLQEAYDNGETIELDDARGLAITYSENAAQPEVLVVDFAGDLTTVAAPSGADADSAGEAGEDGDELLVTSGAGGTGADSADLVEATGGDGGDSLDVHITTGPGGNGGGGSATVGAGAAGDGGNSGSLYLDTGIGGLGGVGDGGDGTDGASGDVLIGATNAPAIHSGHGTPWNHTGMLRTVPVTVTPNGSNVFAIDGSTGNDFFLTLAANSSLTFSNMTAGQSGHIFANNNGGAWSLDFPTGATVQRRVGETLDQVGTGWTIYAYSVRTTNVVYVALASDGGWENNA